MEDVKWLTRNEVLINGWVFNFSHMVATRNQWQINGRNRLALVKKFVGSHELAGYDCKLSFLDEVSKRRAAGQWDVDGDFYSFFIPPEDRYNAIIDEAYSTWCLEQAIHNSDPNTDTED